jgi:hypothetical protein
MRYRFVPEFEATSAAAGPGSLVSMFSGEVYDLSDEWAARILAIVPGRDGAPSLVPVDEAPAAPEPSAPAAPVKARGRKG